MRKPKDDNTTEFPQVDLPVDLIVWTDVTGDILNIHRQSCRLKACIFALCIEGSITVSINLTDTKIKQGDFVTLLSGTIIQFYGQKEKVRIGFTGFSEHCLNGVDITQSTMNSYSRIIRAPVIPLNEPIASYFKDYFSLLARISTGSYIPRTRMTQSMLNMFLYGISELYSSRPESQNRIKSRKEEVYREFIQLVIENYTTEYRTQFYAKKLDISLQHLNTMIKLATGRGVLNLIAHVVIIDIKARLKSTNMTIQGITYSLNSPSASFFGKYFKGHMGMNPLKCRSS